MSMMPTLMLLAGVAAAEVVLLAVAGAAAGADCAIPAVAITRTSAAVPTNVRFIGLVLLLELLREFFRCSSGNGGITCLFLDCRAIALGTDLAQTPPDRKIRRCGFIDYR